MTGVFRESPPAESSLQRRAHAARASATGSKDAQGKDAHIPPPEYPFTHAQLVAALPADCFERNHWVALGQVVQTTATSGALLWLLTWAPVAALPLVYVALGFSLYGYLAIGHECAHGSFTRWPLLNKALGSVTMLAGFMPFENWRQAHFLHHRWTAHEDLEEYFTYSRVSTPVLTAIRWMLRWLSPIGLFLMHFLYLCGLRGKNGKLSTDSLFYNPEMNNSLSLVNFAMVIVQWSALAAGFYHAPAATLKFAFVPLCACGAANLMIGYMQHRDETGELVAFDATAWTKLRGALQTVDRSFWPFDFMLHGAARYHVCHHLFPTMPHYNAPKAMAALADILGPHYHNDGSTAFIKYHPSLNHSHLVAGDGVLRFYRADG